MYNLLQRCRYKLFAEASQPNIDLRVLVGHANMLDDLKHDWEAQVAWTSILRDIKEAFVAKSAHIKVPKDVSLSLAALD